MYKTAAPAASFTATMHSRESFWAIFDLLPHGLILAFFIFFFWFCFCFCFYFFFKSTIRRKKYKGEKIEWWGENEKECETPLENIIATLRDFHCEFIVVKSSARFLVYQNRVCVYVGYLIFNVGEGKRGNFVVHVCLHVCVRVCVYVCLPAFWQFGFILPSAFQVAPLNWLWCFTQLSVQASGSEWCVQSDIINRLWKYFICDSFCHSISYF